MVGRDKKDTESASESLTKMAINTSEGGIAGDSQAQDTKAKGSGLYAGFHHRLHIHGYFPTLKFLYPFSKKEWLLIALH